MKTLARIPLKDGNTLEIIRIILPEEAASASSWMLDEAKRDLPDCWGAYYDHSFACSNPECRDYLYFGLVNDVPASRMWFGYSTRTRIGNFGNVQTLPEYRRRGIMGALLKYCVEDFRTSGALSVSCDAADAAAPAYAAYGFQRIFTPDMHPMALTAATVSSFSELNRQAYAAGQTALVRQGTIADRFDCDKLLAYSPELYGKTHLPPNIPDYLSLWNLAASSSISILVLELKNGFIAGYSFTYQGASYTVLHPNYSTCQQTLLNK